jgi:hypothetical protein
MFTRFSEKILNWLNELLSENAEQLLGVLPLTYSTVGNLVEKLDKI